MKDGQHTPSACARSERATQHTFAEYSGHEILEGLWLRKGTEDLNFTVLGKICDAIDGGLWLVSFSGLL